MKKIYIITILLIMGLGSYAQQDAMYSQYMFNPMIINPAYAGSRESVSLVLLHRSQWLGIHGAPQTSTFSGHMPFKGTNMAAGVSFISDKLGPSENASIFGTFAYHLRLSTGKLSFGIRGGVYSSKLNYDKLNYKNPTDHFNVSGVEKTLVPSFDFGMYYYTTRFYLGVSSTHLSRESLSFTQLPDNAQMDLERHIFATTGYAMTLSDNIIFKPSVLVRYAMDAPIDFDINASFLFKKTFWLGSSFRLYNSIVFLTEYNVTDYLRIGYSYDMGLNELKKYNSGSHEIFIGFDFSVLKVKSISTRLL